MKLTAIIPVYKTPKMVAYSVSQLLKFKGDHELKIIVVNNYPSEKETLRYLQPFIRKITYVEYPENRLQSHGIAFDWVIENGLVDTDYFITLESDSFPTKEGWIDYYEKLINDGCDAAGSLLELSGGLYLHPCGTLYSMSLYNEVKKYSDSINYSYFPNMNTREGFDCHLMIHNSVLDDVLKNPSDYFDLAKGYKPYTKELALSKRDYYKPTCGVFHNGMGGLSESIKTYGQRTFENDVPTILLDNTKRKIIPRIGYEPGQFFSYVMAAMGKSVFVIPIDIKWMPNREGQQQEYTINEAGIKHLWAISSYTERGSKDVEDIYELKTKLPDILYETLPENEKI